MPRPGKVKVQEKPNNFGAAIKRLIKSLMPWLFLMIVSLILAMVSSILSIITPRKLSDLTDTITLGLVPNTEKLQEISTTIFSGFNSENIQNKIEEIYSDSNISHEDKITFNEIMSKFNSSMDNKEELLVMFTSLPESIKFHLLNDITIDGVEISVSDQIIMINLMAQMNDNNENSTELFNQLPESIYSLVKPIIDMKKIKHIAIIIGTLYILSSLFGYIQGYSMATISNYFAKELRSKISNKINTLPLKYFDIHESGDILSRITNDVDMVAMNLSQTLSSLVSNVTLFLGSLFMMFYTNWIMSVTAIVASLVGFSLMFLILGKSQKYFNQRQTELGKLNGYIEEMYSGHNVVKAYNGTEEAIKHFSKLNDNLYESNRKSQFLSGLMQPIMGFVGNFGYVAVCIVGALLTMNGTISFGVIVAFMIYVRLFTNPLSQIAQAMASLQSTAAASERVFEFLDEQEMSNQKDCKNFLDVKKVKGNIEFEHVKFGYNESKTIIKDFSIKVKPGQKVAIVGPTGAGKTTMVNLLMKFYEINDGNILIDGVNTKDLTRENIHELFCMVLQDTWLLDDTIENNIKFNNKNVTKKDVWDVCKVVGVDHFIKTLPGGLDYVVGDSDTVSQGQKQLFTIARGMLKNAPFLILDEATSNVDTRTEELVQKAMDKLTKGKTSFIIAHRLSTIKNADLILVMNEGNIIEQGSHEELMKQKGFYEKLYNSQFEKTI